MIVWECENSACRACWRVRLFSCPRCRKGATLAKSTVNNGVSDATVQLETPVTPDTPAENPVVDPIEEVADEATRERWVEHYSAKTKAELIDELWGLELSTSGNKPELVDRLVEHRMSKPQTEAKAGVAEAQGKAHG